MNAIEILKVTKNYKTGFLLKKKNALNNVSLSVKSGEIYGFLGPNGAGKTTTIKILTSLLFPDSGDVYINGIKLPNILAMKQVGYLPENPSFYSHITGYEFLEFCGHIFEISIKVLHKRIPNLLSLVGLESASNMKIRTYSKGMLQRLGIAQALINDPSLLILDEPMEGLDPIGRKDVKAIMSNLKKQGKTIFFSTHILSDVEEVCDRVGIIISGHLVREGSIDDLLKPDAGLYIIKAKNVNQDVLSRIHNLIEIVELSDSIKLVFNNINDCNEAMKTILDNNGTIISLAPETKTLEDYFVSISGHKK